MAEEELDPGLEGVSAAAKMALAEIATEHPKTAAALGETLDIFSRLETITTDRDPEVLKDYENDAAKVGGALLTLSRNPELLKKLVDEMMAVGQREIKESRSKWQELGSPVPDQSWETSDHRNAFLNYQAAARRLQEVTVCEAEFRN